MRAIKGCLFVVLFGIFSVSANAASVDATLLDLGNDRWQANYTITNESLLTPIEEIAIYFDANLYENLAAIETPDDWDWVLFQSDTLINEPGVFDTYDYTDTGIAQNESVSGFVVEFDWLGFDALPHSQSFDVLDPLDFSVITFGDVQISEIPLPFSLPLFLSALMLLGIYKRRT